MNRGIHRKLSDIDRFERLFRCNPHRFVKYMKREANRQTRRKLKRIDQQENRRESQ